MTPPPGSTPDEWDRRAGRAGGHDDEDMQDNPADTWPDNERPGAGDMSALSADDATAGAGRSRTDPRTYGPESRTDPRTYGNRTGEPPHGADERAGLARTVRLTPASDIPRRKPVWLWQDRIPYGQITLMPGREGIGKSLALCWLSARITRGQLPGVFHGQPRGVIYAATEDSWSHTIGPRLAAAGADLDRVFRADVLTGEAISSLTLPLDIGELFGEARQRGVALLACDPLLSLLGGHIDANKDQQLRSALEPLKTAAEMTGCTVVGLAHFNKSSGADPLNLITGSRAWPSVARAVLAIARDPADDDGGCVMTLDKCNVGPTWPDIPSLRYVIRTVDVDTQDGPAETGSLVFTGETPRGVREILAETTSDPAERAERDEAAEWLTSYLMTRDGGEATSADVRKAARADGIAERTLRRAAARAGVTLAREGFPARTIWRLDPNAANAQSPVRPVRPQ